MRFERKEPGWKERREWFVFLASLSLAIGALAGLHFCGVQLCLFHKFTGLPCPVCGSSRALLLLLQGEVPAAFQLQPLAVIVMPAAVIVFLLYSYLLLFHRISLSIKTSERERIFVFSAAVFLIAVNWGYLLLHGGA